MRKTYDYITATTRVVNDKIYDYVSYYASWKTETNELEDSESDEDLDRYNSILNVENYTEEKSNKRIFNGVGIYREYSIFFGPPTHIVDNIYLGSAFNAASYTTLKGLGVNIIINMTKEISQYFKTCGDFEYIQYDLYDDNKGSIKKYLDEVYNKVLEYQDKDDEGNYKNRILIHCYMGASRSASVVIYYLLKKNKDWTFDDAVKFLRDKRENVNPTFRFTKDLAQSFIQ